jgi:predicted short-subunit dehydrogenase-like oxidoreductase (DUF2520 family)
VIGRGRAGGSFAAALREKGASVTLLSHTHEDLADVLRHFDVALLCVPDHAIAPMASAIKKGPGALVHVSGATALGALGGHGRVGSLHPLMTLPDATRGSHALQDGGFFAVAGDGVVGEMVNLLGGQAVEIAEHHRVEYHAAAVVASNHLVAVLSQAERLARRAGLPFEALRSLSLAAVTNTYAEGSQQAITGPAARGDAATVQAHLALLAGEDRELYRTAMRRAALLGGQGAGLFDGP